MKTTPEKISTNIILIGYRGCGKTTVAKELSTILGNPYVDTDEIIKQQVGKTIAEIFSDKGEIQFRQYERSVITDLAQHPPKILSVGGGAILDPQNVTNLRAIGTIFWLQATEEMLRKRMEQHQATATDRPALRGDNPLDEIAELLVKRSPLYEKAATHIIDTTNQSPTEVAKRIIELV